MESRFVLLDLLIFEPRHRILVQEIKKHPFFASIDFNRLLNKELSPPFKPAVTTIDSTLYFDPEFTKRTPKGEYDVIVEYKLVLIDLLIASQKVRFGV